MHISILADPVDNQKAGVHVYTKNLIENLLRLDQQNSYSFVHLKENNLFKGLRDFVIPRKKIPGYGSYRKFHLIPQLLSKINPDIVLETMHIGPFRTPPRAKKATIIHDLTPILFPQFHINRSSIIHKLFLSKVIKEADLIICPSKNTKNDIKNYCNTKALIKVIPPGITPAVKTKYPPLFPTPYSLYFGTIEPRKNLETLIQAFQELKKEANIPHHLILAGEIGWKSKKILQKSHHPDIVLTGYVNQKEKISLFQNADIFIYPSFYEGFGIPPLEALSYQIPTICSNGGSLKELFKDYSLQFDPQDKNTLKAHLKQLIQNKNSQTQFKEAGRAYAQQFTWEKTAKLTLEAFNEIS